MYNVCVQLVNTMYLTWLERTMSLDHFLISYWVAKEMSLYEKQLCEQYLKDLDLISSLFFKKTL